MYGAILYRMVLPTMRRVLKGLLSRRVVEAATLRQQKLELLFGRDAQAGLGSLY